MSKILPELDYLQGASLPDSADKARLSPAMLRLQDVGMHCGLEYTSFPYFQKVKPYSRYAHSLGVAEIVAHFGGSETEILAGLFHDVATPTFAHVIDFLMGDPLNQEATEEGSFEILGKDKQIQYALAEAHLKTEDVADYHRFPLCDNASPKLSADRLEYTLANFLHFGFASLEEAQGLYDDLIFAPNEAGENEIQFQSLEKAHRFGMLSLRNSIMYTRAEDRYAMHCLAKVLGGYLEAGILTKKDLMGTESHVLDKIGKSGKAEMWLLYHSLYEVVPGEVDPKKPGLLYTDDIATKKRYIDPYVKGKGRLSSLDPEFKEMLDAFLEVDFSIKLSGYTKPREKSAF